MANKWIEHVKAFAKEKGIAYGCALSHPDLKKGYKTGKTTFKQTGYGKYEKVEVKAPSKYVKKIDKTNRYRDIMRTKINGDWVYHSKYDVDTEAWRAVGGKWVEVGVWDDKTKKVSFFDKPKAVPDNLKLYNPSGREIIVKERKERSDKTKYIVRTAQDEYLDDLIKIANAKK